MTLSAQHPWTPPEQPPAEAIGSDEIVREQVLCSLTPFFLGGAAGDATAARAAALYMLDGYSTETTEELQIAAQIIACGLAALDSLRRSMADRDLPVTKQLRLRGSANAMNRAVQQGRKALELRRKARATPQTAVPARGQPVTPVNTQAAIRRAVDAVAFARSDLDITDTPRTYWQQRRSAERQARLAQRRVAQAAGEATAA
jgi:hypothetical protein